MLTKAEIKLASFGRYGVPGGIGWFNALIDEYQRALGLGLEKVVAAAVAAVVPRAIVVLPALSFISAGASDVAPLDPSLLAAVAVTLSVVAT
jgi:hypothetical protein